MPTRPTDLGVEVEEALRAVDVVEGSEGGDWSVDGHGVEMEGTSMGHEHPLGVRSTHKHLGGREGGKEGGEGGTYMCMRASICPVYIYRILSSKCPWAFEIDGPKNGGGRLHRQAICMYNAYT